MSQTPLVSGDLDGQKKGLLWSCPAHLLCPALSYAAFYACLGLSWPVLGRLVLSGPVWPVWLVWPGSRPQQHERHQRHWRSSAPSAPAAPSAPTRPHPQGEREERPQRHERHQRHQAAEAHQGPHQRNQRYRAERMSAMMAIRPRRHTKVHRTISPGGGRRDRGTWHIHAQSVLQFR